MNWEQVEDRWSDLKNTAKAGWGRLAGGLGCFIAGKGKVFAGEACERHKEARDQATEAVEDVTSRAFHPGHSSRAPMVQGLALVGVGAGLMYILDPQQGRRRRALVRDQLVRALHEIDDAIGVLSRDLGNRSRGAWSGLRSLSGRLAGEAVPDDVLVERVRAKLGRYVSHPHAIEVDVSGGRICLTGPALAHEVDDLLEAIASVPGVAEVANRLDVHDRPGGVPSLQGARRRVGERAELWQSNWSPTARLLVGTAGGTLLAAGLGRRDLAGLALGGIGVGLLARAVTNIPFRDWAARRGAGHLADPDHPPRSGDRRRAIVGTANLKNHRRGAADESSRDWEIHAMAKKTEKKHLKGVGAKEQRQYEHIKESAERSGRYGGRAKEVAARTVMKHHKQGHHKKGE